SEGSAPRVRARPVRWTAAAAVHRARAGGETRYPVDGRAGIGTRPHRHAAHRGTDLSTQGEIHYRDRDSQYAAGGARVRLHGVLLAWVPDRVRAHRQDV